MNVREKIEEIYYKNQEFCDTLAVVGLTAAICVVYYKVGYKKGIRQFANILDVCQASNPGITVSEFKNIFSK